MASSQASPFSLKFSYPIVVRATWLTGILLLAILFLFYPRVIKTLIFEDQTAEPIKLENIPPTVIEKTPPPVRPSTPLESESEDLAEDLSMFEMDLEKFEAWEAPPLPSEGPDIDFVAYDEPPVQITSIRPKYPEIAQEAGIEGKVTVRAFIDEKGRVKKVFVKPGEGIPNTGLNEAAIEAVRKARFKPAKQRERPVAVWIAIQVNFRLRN